MPEQERKRKKPVTFFELLESLNKELLPFSRVMVQYQKQMNPYAELLKKLDASLYPFKMIAKFNEDWAKIMKKRNDIMISRMAIPRLTTNIQTKNSDATSTTREPCYGSYGIRESKGRVYQTISGGI